MNPEFKTLEEYHEKWGRKLGDFLFRKEHIEGFVTLNKSNPGKGSFDVWFEIVLICLILFVFLVLFIAPTPAKAADIAKIHAIIGEAEGEGYPGMLAVACAIRNRGSLKGVYGLRAKRVVLHLYSQKTYALAEKAWKESRSLDITNGATGWGNSEDVDKFCSTPWWKKCEITLQVGNHYFYREIKK